MGTCRSYISRLTVEPHFFFTSVIEKSQPDSRSLKSELSETQVMALEHPKAWHDNLQNSTEQNMVGWLQSQVEESKV